MRNLMFRLFLIIIFWVLLFLYIFPWSNYWINIPYVWGNYKLWLDLQWWIELDYKVDLSEIKDQEKTSGGNNLRENEIIEWLKSIVEKRIQAMKINDSSIISSDYAWEKHIIVQIPLKWNNSMENQENIKKAKDAIWKVVKIEFKEKNPNYKSNEVVVTWTWITWTWVSIVWTTWTWVTWTWSNEEWIRAVDSKWRFLSDLYFVKSSVQFNQAFQPMVELTFNDEWAQIFWELTERLVWKQIAIFVGWELLTAPNVNEQILWGKAVITWTYTPESAKKLSNDINTWVVPAPIYLTSEKTIDSKLWVSSLEKLIDAWMIWFFAIFIFLLFVYRLSWVMASIALLIYTLIVLVIVKLFWIVLTLAWVAGLILSIWMAIDANVLIFERMKEEIRLWKNFIDSTSIWFKKSWTAIWDSHVTWFVTAMILYIFWINLIKWFWLMLWIWIIVSLFSAMWVSRILIDVFAHYVKNKEFFIGK